MRYITKYLKEILIGRDVFQMKNKRSYDISPLFPLLTFPDRDNKIFINLEHRMRRAETSHGSRTPRSEMPLYLS